MSRNIIETVMGALVLVVAAVFLFFAYRTSQIHGARGYELTARFERVDGIREGGDVRLSGIKVGSRYKKLRASSTRLAYQLARLHASIARASAGKRNIKSSAAVRSSAARSTSVPCDTFDSSATAAATDRTGKTHSHRL